MIRFRITVAILSTIITFSVHAWNGPEHVEIGKESYYRACLQARGIFGASKDAALIARLRLACGVVGEFSPSPKTTSLTFTYGALAGEWSRLAADHTQSPEQLTSIRLGDLVVGYGQMTSIAINNYQHFFPASVVSWRTSHAAAVGLAAAAVHSSGIDLAERFEHALATEAFAQHYLQDSFASGHMAFNRIASSNSTALAYHDRMSRIGRCVANEDGDSWFTFGDDHLHSSKAGAEHVVDASTASFLDFLESFIQGTANSDGWHATWSKLPSTFSEHIQSPSACVYSPGWPALRTVQPPAPGVSSFEIFTVTDASLYKPPARSHDRSVARPRGAHNDWLPGYSYPLLLFRGGYG